MVEIWMKHGWNIWGTPLEILQHLFSFKSYTIRFFGSDALRKGIEGVGVIIGKNVIEFFHVSEHVDHLKAIKVFSLWKKPEITPPPCLVKHQTFSGFFL